MTRLRYLMTEGVELCCTVADPAAYLNALCRAGIPFTDVSLEADGCHLLVPPRCRGACVAQAQALKLPCSQVRRHGIRHFFRRFRRRAYLWLLPLLLFVITGVFSTFLWEIRVSGAETISNARILQALEESGVYPGVNGLALRNLEIRGRMQLALPELIWCTVQVHGSRAEVKVRERTQPPKMVEEGVPCDLMARKTGLITFLSVLNGDALVKKGQMVLQGETLVTGTLSDRWDQTRTVHAMGEVWARTWYEKSMSMPLVQTEKYYTGQETTRRALKICDLRLNIYGNSGNPYPDCDKIEQETRLCVFEIGRAHV